MVSLCKHPKSSVISTEYVPGRTATKSSVVHPLLHKYVYGAVPPETVKSIYPSCELSQDASVITDAVDKLHA